MTFIHPARLRNFSRSFPFISLPPTPRTKHYFIVQTVYLDTLAPVHGAKYRANRSRDAAIQLATQLVLDAVHAIVFPRLVAPG